METGERRWHILGCYLAPDETSKVESVVSALKERTQGLKLLVTGNFNANIWIQKDIGGGSKLRQR